MKGGLVFKYIALLIISCSFAAFSVQAQLDDPTRPPGFRLALPGGKTSATTNYFSVSSIRLSATQRIAIINDRTVETGDRVNGAKVVAIYPSAVKLKKQGKIFTVRLITRLSKKIRPR